MNRQEVREELLELSREHKNILIELPTGFGKTKVALDIINSNKKNIEILIVVPRLVLEDEWRKEISKWKVNTNLIHYTFTTYASLGKHGKHWDYVIFDEAHHITNRCIDILKNDYSINRAILLSATVPEKTKINIQSLFPDIYCYKVNMKEAIDNEVLPDPKVYLIPLTLNNTNYTELIIKNPRGKDTKKIQIPYPARWSYIKQKDTKVRITCTQQQYMQDLDGQIEWWKKKYLYTRNDVFRNKWLRLCSDRLKWLSEKKIPFIKSLLDQLSTERTLTFCNNIEQTEILGKYCINSKNTQSTEYLEKFNTGKINHITACNMLNEGLNLVNCRIGIYGNLNSSEIIIKQRLGRILRHAKPIIIIPYYKGTREEELVSKMLEDYNPELIKVIDSLNSIKV